MSVIFVLPTDTLAGAELTLKRIAKYLCENDYDVHVIFMSKGDNGNWDDIPANKVYLKAKRERFGIFLLLFEILKIRFRGVEFEYSFSSHVHCNAFISLFRRVGLLTVKKQISRESTNIFSCFSGSKLFTFRILYHLYTNDLYMIFQTKRMQNELFDNIPRLSKRKSLVLHNPIDFTDVHRKSFLDKDTQGEFEIVAVGRLVREKGYEYLLEAFSLLDRKDYTLRIIGSGPLMSELVSLAINLGIIERVIFMGFSDNPLPYIRKAKLSVLSSVNEGFPNVLLEMMSVGNRVIATKCTDGIDRLPGITVCGIGSSQQLANAMSSSLSLTEYDAENMKDKMRTYVKRLSPEKYVGNILSFTEQ
ncbi:glycosyltransferase [Vibrio cionasavignyae]|uniref:glycosyltransferase n=1 Tax=Vibrio cionasavignyae TaxID=2910252 RepID=UPI003D14D4BD